MPDTSMGAAVPGQRLGEVERARERRPTAPDSSLMGLGAGSGLGSDRERAAHADVLEVQDQHSPLVEVRETEHVDSPQEERQEEEQQQHQKRAEEDLAQGQQDQIVWGEGL